MYSDQDLRDTRHRFLRDNKPQELRRLRKEGLLVKHLQERADACRKEQKRLVASGETFDEQAWHWAVRTKLLDSPMD